MELAGIATLFSTTSAISVTNSPLYDKGWTPITELECYKKGTGRNPPYHDGDTLWRFAPRIMGIESIDGQDLSQCGSCWMLEYEDIVRPFLAIDGAESGIEISLEGMNALTDGMAEELGRVEVKAKRVDESNCGLSSAGNNDM